MPPKQTPQEIKDKKFVVSGINEARKALQENEIAKAYSEINKITPIINRLHIFEYELCLMNALIRDKEEKYDECINFAKNASRLKPNEILPRKLLIKNYGKNEKKENELINEMTTALKLEKQDISLMIELIAPRLKDIDDDHHDLTLLFIEKFKKIENFSQNNIGHLIPETDDTIEFRIDLLRPRAQEDLVACSTLISILIYEVEDKDIEEMTRLSKLLPANDENRLLFDALFGDDPLGSAKKYDMIMGKDKFDNFIKNAEKNDLKTLRKQLDYEKVFPSGWLYYASQTTENKEKVYAYNRAFAMNPRSVSTLRKLADFQLEINDTDGVIDTFKRIKTINPSLGSSLLVSFLIKTNRLDEAEGLFRSYSDITPADKAMIDFHFYQKSGNKDLIRPILKLPYDKSSAHIISSVAFELKEELGDKCQQIFAECLKCDKENAIVYLYFAKWLDLKGETQKANFMFEKAVGFGTLDDLAFDRVTRRLIGEEKLEEALELCIKVDNDWSHFRAGLILQRLGKHESACGQFQAEVTKRPTNLAAWSALGQSYLTLGRAMSCLSVAEFLREQNKPDLELEYQVDRLFEKPIFVQDFQIEKTPNLFFSYLQQSTSNIEKLRIFGRIETCKILISSIESNLDAFQQKWGNLGAVLKLCGDFYLTAYRSTKNPQYTQKAIIFMKRRAEIDVRPESFNDLSNVLITMGQHEQAVQILRRVVHKFVDNAALWTNLGVAFALTNRIPFARHCLCVAAKIATDTESGKVFAYCSAIAKMIDDHQLKKKAADAAKRANPYDPDVWQLSVQGKPNEARLDAALISYEFGPVPNLISMIPRLYLKYNKPIEALGYALMANDNDMISRSYEALGKYDLALDFAKVNEGEADDTEKNRQSRLLALCGQKQEMFKIANIFNEKNYNKALEQLKSDGNDVLAKIASAVCLAALGKKDEAAKVLLEVKNEGPSYLVEGINKLLYKFSPDTLQINTKTVTLKNQNVKELAELVFLKNMRKNCGNVGLAATDALREIENNPRALSIYLLHYLKDEKGLELEMIDERADSLMILSPTRETFQIKLAVNIKKNQWNEAKKTLQKLYMMQPNLIEKTKTLFNEIIAKCNEVAPPVNYPQ